MLQSEEEIKNEPLVSRLLFVRGRPFFGFKLCNKDMIEKALDFKPRDTDILICTYPKCGTHWMKYIVYSIINKCQKPLQSLEQLTFEAVPYVEVSGIEAVEALPDPRPLHYHLPYDMIPKNPKAKYIYMFRNPKDTVVSFYHYTKKLYKMDISFDEYFESFMKGLVEYGDYFDHILSWYEHRHDFNVLFLSYEQIQAETPGQILRIAKFLGNHFYEELKDEKELLALILKQTSFENMKKTILLNKLHRKKYLQGRQGQTGGIPSTETYKPLTVYELKTYNIDRPFESSSTIYENKYAPIFRKGIIGDWKNLLSPEQNQRMDDRIQEKFRGTEIIDMFDVNKAWK